MTKQEAARLHYRLRKKAQREGLTSAEEEQMRLAAKIRDRVQIREGVKATRGGVAPIPKSE